jgi:hypothetical protein
MVTNMNKIAQSQEILQRCGPAEELAKFQVADVLTSRDDFRPSTHQCQQTQNNMGRSGFSQASGKDCRRDIL